MNMLSISSVTKNLPTKLLLNLSGYLFRLQFCSGFFKEFLDIKESFHIGTTLKNELLQGEVD